MIRIELPGGMGRTGGRERGGGGGEAEEEEEEDEMRELEMRIEKAQLPEHALKAAQKELKVWEICLVYIISVSSRYRG